MAPRGVSTWRRPYTSIYNDNYRYGTGLYSDTLSDIEKRYSNSLSKTQLRSDRPDLSFTTFASSTLTSSPTPAGEPREPSFSHHFSEPSSPVKNLFKGSTFESRLNSAFHSSYAEDDDTFEHTLPTARKQKARIEEDSRPKSLYDDASFWTLPKTPKTTENQSGEFDLDALRSKRKLLVKGTTTNGPTSTVWREKSRDIQNQVETLEKAVADSSSKLKNDLSTLKSRYHSDITDLNSSVEQSSQYANELQKTVKKQANQLQELQGAYDDAQRNLKDTLEEMETWQTRYRNLKKEMNKLQDEVEQAMKKKNVVQE